MERFSFAAEFRHLSIFFRMISRHASANVRIGRRKYGLTDSSYRISWSSTGQLFFYFSFRVRGALGLDHRTLANSRK